MSPALLLAISGIFISTAVLVGMVTSWWLARNSPEQRRLRTLAQGAAGSVVLGQSLPSAGRLTGDDVDPMLARLSKLVPKSPADMSRLQRRLARAGYPSRDAAIYFSLAQLMLPILLGGGVLLFMGPVSGWVYALFAAAVGYLLPSLYISRKTAERQKAIQNGLADALDLLTVCVEAGSGLDQAIVKASEELAIAHPALAAELRMITTETRAGKPRLEAFKNFAQRTGVDDVRSLVAMLTQTDRFGTSVGQALRTHAETIRTKRRQNAEERAAKVSVKLVFPLALCLFPALYVVCFGPVVIRIYHAFFESGF
jgi:tight adherence protein C